MGEAGSKRRVFAGADLVVLLLIGAFIYTVVTVSQEWRAEYNPVTQIDLSGSSLLRYAFLSGSRGMVAYLLSLFFTLLIGYVAAKSRTAERIILPALDILQSIPVVGFMPGVVLSLIALFPGSQFGLELAAVLNVFFGQVWNMIFSYYSSLKSVPVDLIEAAEVIHLSPWERLKRLELPFSAIPLAWNSLLSMAGGWFFLSLCEAFSLGRMEFRLPGLGSYMAVAISQGNGAAMLKGAAAMILLIVMMDFVLWRPIMAWVQRFRMEAKLSETDFSEPLMSLVYRDAQILLGLRKFYRRTFVGFRSVFRVSRKQVARLNFLGLRPRGKKVLFLDSEGGTPGFRYRLEKGWALIWVCLRRPQVQKGLATSFYLVASGLALWGGSLLFRLLAQLSLSEAWLLARNGLWTLLRVLLAVALSTLWAVPVGIWIGTNARRLRIAQPLVQIAASFPAPMLYPLVILWTERLGIPFSLGSIFLLMLGVQWYILFNVLAGALRIPQELGFAMDLMECSRWERWKSLYLPSVFPALVTGWVTAAGGAWNASIVAEAITVQGQSYVTAGLGAMIMESSGKGNAVGFASALTLMVGIVLLFNSLVWTRLYRMAQSRYRMD